MENSVHEVSSLPSPSWFGLAMLFLVLLQGLAVHGPWTVGALDELVVAAPRLVDGHRVLHPVPAELLEQLGLVHGEHVPASIMLAHAGLGAEVAYIGLISWTFPCHARLFFLRLLLVTRVFLKFLHYL